MSQVDVAALRWRCDADQFPFQTTDELSDLGEIVGQARAQTAVRFGISMRREGYNLFVLGPPGIGKRTVVERLLHSRAADEATPDEWCYVSRVDDVRRPRAIRLPPGRGAALRQDVAQLVADLDAVIPSVLESEDQKRRIQEVARAEAERENEAFKAVGQKALARRIQMIRTPAGFALGPLRNGEILGTEEFQKLPEEERKRIEQDMAELQQELEQTMEQVPRWNQETRERVRQLNREAVNHAIGHLIAQARAKYSDLTQVLTYFDDVERDILERTDAKPPVDEGPLAIFGHVEGRTTFEKYLVNLLVDHSGTHGAPIIWEDHPSYHNLLGRVEHESQMGTLTTDFRQIRAGALHRANGGYLILEAHRLLQQPFAWEGLKRALFGRRIQIESLGDMLSLISTVTLEPEPIPLDVKVVLVGDRLLYYLLYELDHEFAELFKVAADFDEELDLNSENCRLYAQCLATVARAEGLLPFSFRAVARVVEEAVREAGDQEKVSLHMRTITDVLREADHWAREGSCRFVEATHVERALAEQRFRSDRVPSRLREEIRRGTIFIDTDGSRVGQVNGLSVIDLGNSRFGHPTRISATARLGRGEVVDIEREVKLGGAIHSKGVLILSSFLAARFARDRPLSLAASLVFEQSYASIDGDSASAAELLALLSAIAGAPLRQDLAITGSVNQLGQIQPIGGVNEKIEGFFDVCRDRGLSGTHGVLIPAANQKHLMLRQDVVDAVADSRFQVHAVETIDQAMTLMSGTPAGEKDDAGHFPAGTFNGLVAARLAEWMKLRQVFGEDRAPTDRRASLGAPS